MSTSDNDDFELIDAPEWEILARPDSPTPKTKAKAKEEGLAASGPGFVALTSSLQKAAEKRPKGPIFHSQLQLPSTLYDTFLTNIPVELQAEHTCTSCRNFVNSFGDLCVVRDDGSLQPLVWPQELHEDIPSLYHNALGAISQLFVGALVGKEHRITSEKGRTLGAEHSKNPFYTHFHITLHNFPLSVEVDGLDTQTSYDMLSRILTDNDLQTINQAHHLINEKLNYATSHKPTINWLQDVAMKIDALEGEDVEIRKRNLTTRFASSAWVGCLSSLRGGIIGTLLEEVAAGAAHYDIEQKWNSLANPLQYQRPTATPALGNIQDAERAFAASGYTKDDLKRYFMTTDQVPEPSGVLWKDKKMWNVVAPAKPVAEGIFGSLKAKASKPSPSTTVPSKDDKAGPTAISFRQFARRVLPNVDSMEVELKNSQNLTFFTSGTPGARSPFAWGSETNTGSWYYWANPGPVVNGNARPGWNEVSAITSFPHMWDYISASDALDYEEPKTHDASGGRDNDAEDSGSSGADDKKPRRWIHSRHGVGFLFCLKDARETQSRELCLFPTFMKGSLHGVRKTVEAYSSSERIQQPVGGAEGEKKQQVAGLPCSPRDSWTPVLVRVRTDKGIVTKYKITLFD